MKILPIFILLMFFAGNSFGQSCGCFELARIVAPVISENTRKVYEEKLAEAKKILRRIQTVQTQLSGSEGARLILEITGKR